MGLLLEQLQKTLPKGMHVPEPIVLLYDWIEANGFIDDSGNNRIGYLHLPSESLIRRNGITTQLGTWIEFAAQNNEGLFGWFRDDAREEVINRLCMFAQAGAEGSMAALWLDDNNEIKIVLMGGGSGSVAMCIIAENAIEFMRLLAIGYDEICWLSIFPYHPNHDLSDDFILEPNKLFQQWVIDTFNVTIPENASEIVRNPAEMGDETSEDKFFQFFLKNADA